MEILKSIYWSGEFNNNMQSFNSANLSNKNTTLLRLDIITWQMTMTVIRMCKSLDFCYYIHS